jgi:hypothetical protein
MAENYHSFSKKWQDRFNVIDALEVKSFTGFAASIKGLPINQKLKRFLRMLSFMGFFFGPLYYLILGMWRKALTLLGMYTFIAFLVSAIFTTIYGDPTDETMIFFGQYLKLGFAAVGLVCSWSVSFDYYLKVKFDDKSWLLAYFSKPIKIQEIQNKDLHSLSSQEASNTDASSDFDLDRLLKLAELKEKGTISNEEFETFKKKMLQ